MDTYGLDGVERRVTRGAWPPQNTLVVDGSGCLVAARECWWCADCGEFQPCGNDDRCTDAGACRQRRGMRA